MTSLIQGSDVAEMGGIVLSSVGMLLVLVMIYFTLWFGALGLVRFRRHQPTANKKAS